MDRELQLVIWSAILDYVINDIDEFNSIYSLCPVLIKEEAECKRLELIFRLMHHQVNVDELLEEDEIKKGQQAFVKRLIYAALVFFVLVIVKVLISAVADSSGSKILECAECFLEGKCDS